MLMSGYWNAPEATAATVQDGWIRTGDIGYVDEHGFVFIVDRKKDMVVSAGENIYCRVVAAIGLREGVRRTAEEVKAFARQHLADYKVPVEIRFDMSPLPRNTLGKIHKPGVRSLYAELQRDRETAGA
jgi:acyl-CoA synthetase (AMP-forming)/AMP-acid ligase II